MLGAGLLRLRALAAKSESVSTGVWRAVADQIATRYGIRQHVRLLRCGHPTLLATWGLVRPTILLPEGAETWTEDSRARGAPPRIGAHSSRRLGRLFGGERAQGGVLVQPAALDRVPSPAARERTCVRRPGTRSGIRCAGGRNPPARGRARICAASTSLVTGDRHRPSLDARRESACHAEYPSQPPTTDRCHASHDTVAIAASPRPSASRPCSGSTERIIAPDVTARPARYSARSPGRTAEAVERTARGTGGNARGSDAATGGTIEGVLYDQFGGLLPGAPVRLTQVGSGSSQNSTTDRGGLFVFRDLPAGDYEVISELPGFLSVKVVVRAEPGATVRRHITMPIGTIEETILVTCGVAGLAPTRPSAPAGSATPGDRATTESGPARVGAENPEHVHWWNRRADQSAQKAFTHQSGVPDWSDAGANGRPARWANRDRRALHRSPRCQQCASALCRVGYGRVASVGIHTDAPERAPIEVNISVTVSYSWSN